MHRPRQFSDVVGQEHVVRTLINQIERGNIGHAYLFCGTRGTGKTSVAKIFAEAVNCLNFKDGKICKTCEYCKKSGGGNLDVFELDAASNNRVEDVRELIEKVKYPPINAKYKVYIVDEVHMFSTSAFNAFLKTLEEPPAHVIFILATTEAHKLLSTVQSRCLRFDFRTVAISEIEKLVNKVFEKEKIAAEPEAIKAIAEAGHGSVRDALSVADMVAAYAGDKVTAAAVCEVIGGVDNETLKKLCSAILNNEVAIITEVVKKIFSVGRNAASVVKDFIEVIKKYYLENYKNQTVAARVMDIYKLFAELEMNIKTAVDAKNMFEGVCLLAAFTGNGGKNE